MLTAQLEALACERFEVQALPPKSRQDLKPDTIRTWTAAEVLESIDYLKWRNSQDFDIFIRPAPIDEHAAEPLVFVDDISRDTAAKMHQEGFPFATLIESSPNNFQGWIRIADYPLPKEELTECARLLAKQYGGDPMSADWRHYGRAAGFTNRKPKYRNNKGQQPFAKLANSCPNTIAPSGSMLISQAVESLHQKARLAKALKLPTPIQPAAYADDAVQAFREAWQKCNKDDLSARDFSACMSLLNRGFSEEEVARALKEVSPDLERRHAPSENYDYVSRTVQKAADIVRSDSSKPKM